MTTKEIVLESGLHSATDAVSPSFSSMQGGRWAWTLPLRLSYLLYLAILYRILPLEHYGLLVGDRDDLPGEYLASHLDVPVERTARVVARPLRRGHKETRRSSSLGPSCESVLEPARHLVADDQLAAVLELKTVPTLGTVRLWLPDRLS